MNEFLEELASRKWRYYHFLHNRKPHAYTTDDCFERIKINAKYQEVLEIIEDLPPKEQRTVKQRFEEITEFF